MYVRMVWGKLMPGMWNEFERYYSKNIGLVTEGMEAFRGRQLLRSTQNPDEGISITYWDNLGAVEAYGRNPLHQENAKEVNHLYTGEYWVQVFDIKSSTNQA